LVWSLCYLVFRCVLQLVLLRARSRELQAAGVEVRLAEPVQARALKGRKRQAKTEKLAARRS